MPEYRYASGDLVTSPNTYFYAPYEGPDFLVAWRASRSAVLATLGEPAAPPMATNADRASRHTADLLARAIAGDVGLREQLLAKFETTRRVHRAYDDGFRAVDRADCHNLFLYLRAADLFEAMHRETTSLRPLNALLKCLDTLCALRAQVREPGRLAWHILTERQHVGRLW